MVPLVVGTNTNEEIMFTRGYKIASVAQYWNYRTDPSIFGPHADEAAATYPVSSEFDVPT